MLYGVDVSEFQGQIDWDMLNSVSNFVVIREGFGTDRKDLEFDRNLSEARRVQASAGPLGIGIYHFAYPTYNTGAAEANFFADNLGTLQGGEILALDLEGNVGSDPVGWALEFLQTLEARTSVKGLIYLNQSLMNSYDWSSVINGDFGLWLADYSTGKGGNPPASPWPVVALLQWTSSDQVAGISGNVDGDQFYGDINAWNAYGYKVPSPSAPTPEPTPPASTPVPEPDPAPVPSQPIPVPVTIKPKPTPVAPSRSLWSYLSLHNVTVAIAYLTTLIGAIRGFFTATDTAALLGIISAGVAAVEHGKVTSL